MNRIVAAACAALLLAPHTSRAEAEDAPPPASSQAELEEEIAKELGAKPPEVRPSTPALGGRGRDAPPGTPSTPPRGGSAFARLLLLPDVSVIGRAAIAWNGYDVEALSPRGGTFSPEDEPRAVLEEVELGLQSVVDPYLRADVFVALGEEGAEVEEAYVTTLSLPWALQLRAGKLYAPFGRIPQQHPHVWEFADAPLAIGRLLAEETIAGPGVEVGWLAPLPWFAELRIAGMSFAPGEEDPDALTAVARALQYFPLGEATTLGVGVSAATRDEGRGAFRDLAGVDVHLRWRPPASRAWISLQGEWWGRRFRGVDGAPGDDSGGYAQAFWKQGPRWGLGARYGWAPTAGNAAPGTERRVAVLAGFFPSEFQRIRLQASHASRPGGDDGLEALLHLEFGFGAHGAHPF